MTASRRKFDFRFPASLAWPAEHWYPAETWQEHAAQDAIAGARRQGLPDRVEDVPTLDKVAALGKR
ncbi:hypothetical protein ADK66_03010 [Micromonospora sp. NRRL B-16802]|nr:hypothetical protein ADK66_03010 [Micromonospora sp. NRRL B-16802]